MSQRLLDCPADRPMDPAEEAEAYALTLAEHRFREPIGECVRCQKCGKPFSECFNRPCPTRPAPDLAALRTSLRVAVERVCYGAKLFPCGETMWALKRTRQAGGVPYATVAFVNMSNGETTWEISGPTSNIGAAMALVDQLQAEGWPGTTWEAFAVATDDIYAVLSPAVRYVRELWLLRDCPPTLRPLVLTIAVLAARGAEWRRFLDLLTDASDTPPAS